MLSIALFAISSLMDVKYHLSLIAVTPSNLYVPSICVIGHSFQINLTAS